MPATSAPRCASRHSAAEPKPPRPTTTTSLRIASIAADLTRLTSAAGQAGSMIRAAGDGPAKSGCGPRPRLVVCVDMRAVECLAGLAPPGGRVLELAIGTGRVAIPLTARGVAVEGVEGSAAMVEQ